MTAHATAVATAARLQGNHPDPPASRVLVLGEPGLDRDLIIEWLRLENHEVAAASGTRDALVKLASGPFDLLVVDLARNPESRLSLLGQVRGDPALGGLRSLVVAPAESTELLADGLAAGADDYLARPLTRPLLTVRVRSALSNGRLSDGERQRARSLEHELEIGRQIQAGFLPAALPEVPGWRLDARLHPAREVSGDFYDAFAFEAGGRVGLIVADVCDKGVGAALYMSLFRSLLRAAAVQRYSGLTGRGISLSSTGFLSLGAIDGQAAEAGRTALSSALKVTNNYIALTHSEATMFATVFFAVLDPATGDLDYANCGHEPPVIVSRTGIKARLGPTGPVVGLTPDARFDVRSHRIDPGDTLFAFTDGLTDAHAPTGELFNARLDGVLSRPVTTARELLDRIEGAVQDHVADAPRFDDMTLLAVQRLVASE